MYINEDEIVSLTDEYGGQWGINHTKRLLQIISVISEGLQYNREAVWVAAYLHDWGGYAKWFNPDIEHPIRSKQLAEEFLGNKGYKKELLELILECIEFHHSDNHNRSIEAMLLSDADKLDLLGIVGLLREFSMKPRDLRRAYETVISRKSKLPGVLCLKKSREIAEKRVKLMDELIKEFDEETFGYF
ncbi:HD domain-containing protein [Clostridium sp. HBUAS56017]|uniref:HD domain-containing protein n=1 Tax=Clostridium sp. HBUAS56017 TaxID=2571128 RepID=UPI0011783953|nr:HD domain-containing protein [Clostridium sp. HBUAS56017]